MRTVQCTARNIQNIFNIRIFDCVERTRVRVSASRLKARCLFLEIPSASNATPDAFLVECAFLAVSSQQFRPLISRARLARRSRVYSSGCRLALKEAHLLTLARAPARSQACRTFRHRKSWSSSSVWKLTFDERWCATSFPFYEYVCIWRSKCLSQCIEHRRQ